MHKVHGSRLFVAACGVAALLSGAACNGNDNARHDANGAANGEPKATAPADQPKGTSGEADKKPISITGCLQKDGSKYIVTEVNRPSGSPVAQGDKDASARIEREQRTAAEHAYRLNDNRDNRDQDLDKMVGRQVRVSGTLADPSSLSADADRDRNAVGTSGSDRKAGSNDSRDREKIDSGDLARVDATSIEQVGQGCGSASAKGSAARSPRASKGAKR